MSGNLEGIIITLSSVNLDHEPLVVGSVGPYGAHLHDGSEYDGSYADTTSIQVNSPVTYSPLSRKSGREYLIINDPLTIYLFYFLSSTTLNAFRVIWSAAESIFN